MQAYETHYDEIEDIADQWLPEDRRIPVFVLMLIPFMIGAIAVSGLTQFNNIVKGYGIICAAAFAIGTIRGFVLPGEMKLLGGYLLWSLMGIFTAQSQFLFWEKFLTLFQIFIMALIFSNYAVNTRTTRLLLGAFFIGSLIVAVSGYVSGEYQNTAVDSVERVAGLQLNANGFAHLLVLGAAVLLYFFRTARSIVIKIGAMAILAVLSVLIIASGSRMGFIAFVILIPLWLFLSYRKELFQRPVVTLVMAILGILFLGYLFYRLQDTLLLTRLGQVGGGAGDGSAVERRHLISEGLSIILSHPLIGVGLSNFIFYSRSGLMSHNNYIEVMANSGILAGIFYYSVFLVLWLRLRRLGKLPLGPRDSELVKTSMAILIIRLLCDLVGVFYYQKENWLLFSIIFGWAYHLEQRTRSEMTQASNLQDEFYDDAEATYGNE